MNYVAGKVGEVDVWKETYNTGRSDQPTCSAPRLPRSRKVTLVALRTRRVVQFERARFDARVGLTAGNVQRRRRRGSRQSLAVLGAVILMAVIADEFRKRFLRT